MERDHEISTGVKLSVGVGVAFLLYWLLWTGGRSGRGTGSVPGTSAAPGSLSPVPGISAVPAVVLPRPRDTQPVEILVHPSSTDPTRAVIEMEGRVVSVSVLIARIDAGKRRDVRVTVRGDTREGGWMEIRDALEFAGIQILRR